VNAVASGRSARPRWHAPERSGPAFGLSLLAHGVLFIAIAFAVRWKTEPAGTVAVELWGGLPPATVEASPPPPPPAIKPLPVEPAPAPRQADIVEKKAEPIKKVEPKKVEPPKMVEPVKSAEPPKKAFPDPRVEQQKREAEARAEQAAQAVAQKQRETAIQRALAAAGASSTSSPASGGSAAGSLGLSDSYKGQVVSCIRPHVVFSVPEGLRPRQYVAEFEVQLLPSGEQVGAPRLVSASGLPAYDQAVERAIRRCDPFPRPREGSMPRSVRLAFDPVELR
jgi:colicin import membrane protein